MTQAQITAQMLRDVAGLARHGDAADALEALADYLSSDEGVNAVGPETAAVLDTFIQRIEQPRAFHTLSIESDHEFTPGELHGLLADYFRVGGVESVEITFIENDGARWFGSADAILTGDAVAAVLVDDVVISCPDIEIYTQEER